ncbi:MAG: T9SS type B sorting domain-containing protein [Marinilabiliaceae bacterium]|nr:T9SS type B sorting domain-containing protein [Marinilabiliaceae bacterium]
MKKYILVIAYMFFSFVSLFSQVDTEFWFVAPEVTDEHQDESLLFRISGLDQTAHVTISQPANPAFTPITLTVNANTLRTINMTEYKSTSENLPINTVNNWGYLITSDVPITVYYEVSNWYNPDKFTLKGENALGTEFFTVGQNDYSNHTKDGYTKAYERIDIVATEDNTQVTVTPTDDCVGHDKDVPFTITLNRGQTYSIQAESRKNNRSLAGTHITSTKNIAVTISDDSIDMTIGSQNPSNWDLIGDQLIPVSVTGTEYVAVRTYFNEHDAGGGVNNAQKLYIVATEDNTNIYFDGNTKNVKKLNRGELYEVNIQDVATLVNSDKPIYVYQLTSINGEMGSAILPPSRCTGSRSVSFVRIFKFGFWVQLATKSKNIDDFTLVDENGSIVSLTSHITWGVVPGTDSGDPANTWYASTIDMSSLVSTGHQYTIKNSSGLFHMGIVDQISSSLNFGYFSSYSSLKIDGLTQQCYGSVVQLNANATGARSYEWYSTTTGNAVLSTSPLLEVTETATYWVVVEMEEEGCILPDSIDVNFNLPEFDLGPADTALCDGEVITFNPPLGYDSYLWDNNSSVTSRSVTVIDNMHQEIWLEITDEQGCTARDTIIVTDLPNAELNLTTTNHGQICLGDTIFDRANMPHYQWVVQGQPINPADTLSYYVPKQAGSINLSVTATTNDGCSTTEMVQVTVNSPTTINLADVSECPNISYTYTLPAGMQTYNWSNGSKTNTATFNSPGEVWVTITDNNGCFATDTSTFDWKKVVEVPLSMESACINTGVTLSANNILVSNYSWSFSDGTNPAVNLNNTQKTYSLTDLSTSNDGYYIVEGVNSDGCQVVDTIDLTVLTVPDINLGNDRFFCDGDSTYIKYSNNQLYNYQWSTPGNTAYSSNNGIWVKNADTYYLSAQDIDNGCFTHDTIVVTVNPLPKPSLPDTIICFGKSYTFNPGVFSSYKWSNGGISQQITTMFPTTVSVTVTNEYGCKASTTGSMKYHQKTYVSAKDTGVCAGDDITLEMSHNLNVGTVKWSFNHVDSVISTGSYNHQINAATIADQGIYIVTGLDVHGCDVRDQLELTVGTTPPLELGVNRPMCIGDTITVDASQGFKTYEWQIGSDPTVITSSYLLVTSIMGGEEIKVKGIHSNGCSQKDTMTITVAMDKPIIDLGGYNYECPEVGQIDIAENFSFTSNSPNPNPDSLVWFHLNNPTQIINSTIVTDPGQYAVLAYNDNMCFEWDTIEVGYHTVAPLSLNSQSVCKYDTIDLMVPSGYTGTIANYNWYSLNAANTKVLEVTNQNLTTSKGGNYVLEIEDNNSCVVEDTMYLAVKPILKPQLGPDNDFCRGDSIIIAAKQGAYKYYEWSRAANPGNVMSTSYQTYVNEADEYYITVTGFNNCYAYDTIRASINELPRVTLDLNAANSICLNSTGNIQISSATANDLTPIIPNYILWSNGEFNKNQITIDKKGSYWVMIEDVNKCKAYDSIDVSYFPKTNIGLKADTGVCDQSTIDLVSPLNIGSDIQSYQWFKGSIGASAPNQAPVDQPWNGIGTNGNYILSIIDNNGCENSDTMEVEILPIPVFDLGANKTMCMGDTILITPQKEFISYMWDNNPADNLNYKVVTTSQNHILTVVNKVGCSASDNISVVANPAPTVELGPDVSVCTYYTATIDAGPGYNYQWSTGETTQSITASRGRYSVLVSDSIGCSSTDTIAIRWYDVPDVYIGRDTFICVNQDLMLDAGSGFRSYKWHDSTTNQTTLAYLNELSEVHVIDANGCYGWDSRLVRLIPIPEINLGNDTTICETDSVLYNAGSGFLDYLWSNNSTDSMTYVANVGQHWVSAYDGCLWVQDTVEIVHFETPVIASFDTLIYARVAIFAEQGTPPYLYRHEEGVLQSNNVFAPLDAGSHVFTVVDDNGCYSMDTVSLTLDIDIDVPNYFTPNNDGYNDTWKIEGHLDMFPDSEVQIYDRYGKLLISYSAIDFEWNGEYNNKPVPSDDYWFVVFLKAENITHKIIKGHFTLKR